MVTVPKRLKTAGPPPPRPHSRGPAPENKDVVDLGDIDSPTEAPKRMSLDRGVNPSPVANPTEQVPVTTPVQPKPFASPASTAVKQMQQAILDFSNTISSMDVGALRTPDTFGNFLGEQYVGVDLAGLAKQMKQIGIPGAQDKADGIWGRNTNQALKSIISVCRGMFALAKDMKVAMPGYTAEQLDALATKLIPSDYTALKDPRDKENRAKEITNHLQTLTMIFRTFKQTVMKTPALKSLVSGENSFIKIPQSPQSAHDQLDQNERKIYEQYKNIPFAPSNATLLDLLTLPAFKIYMTENKLDPQKPEEVTKALDQIGSAISAG